jgi:hypothetical protein
MDELTEAARDPHDEIERLEERIDELAARIESCRKVAAAARVAIAVGGALLLALIVGLIAFDPLVMTAAIVALLGGIVLLGSNRSTTNEAKAELAAAEADRTALIGAIELRVVGGRETLH